MPLTVTARAADPDVVLTVRTSSMSADEAARLIESVPAMLDALEAAQREMAYRVSTRNSDALQQVRAAIAAATNT